MRIEIRLSPSSLVIHFVSPRLGEAAAGSRLTLGLSVPHSVLEYDPYPPSFSPLISLKMDDLHCNSLKCRKALGLEVSRLLSLLSGART